MGTGVSRGLTFGVLGPLEVRRRGEPVRLGGERQRALLALLVLRANELVRTEVLIDQLVGERRSDGALNALRVAVSRLRRVLEEDGEDGGVLQTRPGGYVLGAAGEQIDAVRFERLLAEGQRLLAAADPAAAVIRLREALGLWRGPALADVAMLEFVQPEIRRLEELRVVAVIERIDAELALGKAGELIGELEALVAANPVQERLRGQLMVALYRAGRQADALVVYRETSDLLRGELGLEPSRALQQLERAVLTRDVALEPPPRAMQPPRSGLPAPGTRLIGRRRELAEVTTLLGTEAVRLLTLTGAGGSGKTRLALRVAEACAENYRDGAWFVAFADVSDPGLIASTICQAVGLTERPDLTPAQRLADWLEGRELLLVLDNLEQLVDGTALLGRLLSSCPGLTLLVTSREPLRLAAEHQYEVPVLEHADAVELFIARARAVAPGRVVDPELAGSICERLDCLPLAIELAAARTKILPAAEILVRLDSRLPLLTGGPRDAPQRQRTLRATIDWSHELLNRDEQRLFARLAVFAGGCTLTAAQQVCGAELDTLHTIVDRSLLRTDGKRYWTLQTLHEYASEQLDHSPDAEEVRRAHARWLVELLDAEGVAPAGWWPTTSLECLEHEQSNFRAALEWTENVGAFETLAQLVSALTAMWVMRGQLHEAQRWITIALQHEDDYPTLLAARVVSAGHMVAQHQGDWVKAAALARRALHLWRAIGDPAPVGRAMISVATAAAQVTGDAADARAAFEQAIRFARAHGLSEALPQGLINLSDIMMKEGDLTEGRALCEEGLALSEPGSHATVIALINLAHIETVEDHPAEAANLYRQAVSAAHQRSELLWVAWATIGSAALLAKQNQLERSGRLLGAGLAFLDTTGAGRDWMIETWEGAIYAILANQLGNETTQALVNQGRNLPLDEAARIALDALAAQTDSHAPLIHRQRATIGRTDLG